MFAKLSLLPGLIFAVLRGPVWAPVFVLIFHYFIVRTPYRVACDNLIHFMGGMAIAWFLLRAIQIAAPLIGALRACILYPFAYALACTAALVWEFAEFASDIFNGTRIQSSLFETMLDLVAGASGAFLVLSVCAVVGALRLPIARPKTA